MISEAIKKMALFENLDYESTYQSMMEIMEGTATPVQISAFLISLKMKGETVDEIFASAKAMGDMATKVPVGDENIIDTCGTGGDGAHTFNISTTAMFVAAAAGVKIAKHGNRSITSKSGAADVLENLGINIHPSNEMIARCIHEVGVGFMFAQNHHSSSKYSVPIRKELGMRTIFNILGPLANPAGAKRQLLGVFDKKLVRIMAEALKKLGTVHAMVVCGEDGLDEITLTGNTTVAELKDGLISEYEINPLDYGFALCNKEALTGASPLENASILIEILKGEVSPRTDIVLLNAGAAIYIGGKAKDLAEGIEMARAEISNGCAMNILEKLRELSKQER